MSRPSRRARIVPEDESEATPMDTDPTPPPKTTQQPPAARQNMLLDFMMTRREEVLERVGVVFDGLLGVRRDEAAQKKTTLEDASADWQGDNLTLIFARTLHESRQLISEQDAIAVSAPRLVSLELLVQLMTLHDPEKSATQHPCAEGPSSCHGAALLILRGHLYVNPGVSVGRSFDFEEELELPIEQKPRRLCVFCLLALYDHEACSARAAAGPSGQTINIFYVSENAPDSIAPAYLRKSHLLTGAVPHYAINEFFPCARHRPTGRNLLDYPPPGSTSEDGSVRSQDLVAGAIPAWSNFCRGNRVPARRVIRPSVAVIEAALFPDTAAACADDAPLYTDLTPYILRARDTRNGSDSGLICTRRNPHPVLSDAQEDYRRTRRRKGNNNKVEHRDVASQAWWRGAFAEAYCHVKARGFPASDYEGDELVITCVVLCPLIVTVAQGLRRCNFDEADTAIYQGAFHGRTGVRVYNALGKRIFYPFHPKPVSDPAACRAHALVWTVLGVTNILLHMACQKTPRCSFPRDRVLQRIEAFTPLLDSISRAQQALTRDGLTPPSDAQLHAFWEADGLHKTYLPIRDAAGNVLGHVPGCLHPDMQEQARLWMPWDVFTVVPVHLRAQSGGGGSEEEDAFHPLLAAKDRLLNQHHAERRRAHADDQSAWIHEADAPCTEARLTDMTPELIAHFNEPAVFGQPAGQPPYHIPGSARSGGGGDSDSDEEESDDPRLQELRRLSWSQNSNRAAKEAAISQDASALLDMVFGTLSHARSTPTGAEFAAHMPLHCLSCLRCLVVGGFAPQEDIPLPEAVSAAVVKGGGWGAERALELLDTYPRLTLIALAQHLRAMLEERPALWRVMERRYFDVRGAFETILNPLARLVASAHAHPVALAMLDDEAGRALASGSDQVPCAALVAPVWGLHHVYRSTARAISGFIMHSPRFAVQRTEEEQGRIPLMHRALSPARAAAMIYDNLLAAEHRRRLLHPVLRAVHQPTEGGLAALQWDAPSAIIDFTGRMLFVSLHLLRLLRLPDELVLALGDVWKMMVSPLGEDRRHERLSAWAAALVQATPSAGSAAVGAWDYHDLVLLRLALECIAARHTVTVIDLRDERVRQAQAGDYGGRGLLGCATSLVFQRDLPSRPHTLLLAHEDGEIVNFRLLVRGSKRVESESSDSSDGEDEEEEMVLPYEEGMGEDERALQRQAEAVVRAGRAARGNGRPLLARKENRQGKPSNGCLADKILRVQVEQVSLLGRLVVFNGRTFTFRGPSALSKNRLSKKVNLYFNRHHEVHTKLAREGGPGAYPPIGCAEACEIPPELHSAAHRAQHPAMKNAVSSVFSCSECGALAEMHPAARGPWYGLHCGMCPSPWIILQTHPTCELCGDCLSFDHLTRGVSKSGETAGAAAGRRRRKVATEAVTKAEPREGEGGDDGDILGLLSSLAGGGGEGGAARVQEELALMSEQRRKKKKAVGVSAAVHQRNRSATRNTSVRFGKVDFSVDVFNEATGATTVHHFCQTCARGRDVPLFKVLEGLLTMSIFQVALTQPRVLRMMYDEARSECKRRLGLEELYHEGGGDM